MSNKNNIRNRVTPHRAQVNTVTISRKETSPIVVIDSKKKEERPVRGVKLFQSNWWKNIGKAREGREDEWPEESTT